MPFSSRDNTPSSPASISELVELVRAARRLIPIGNATKSRLSKTDAAKISTRKLAGITEYDPGEYTFTALAGTAVRDIIEALNQRGQHLPFDPPFAAAGATLGGTVAAGLSGPRRFRFGGIRDFILGVRFVDGDGKLLRMGGKVVKNAAGFDLPKFFVGSLGRFGVIVELTFKVFPQPRDWLTLELDAGSIEEAVSILIKAANNRWEPYALDFSPEANHVLLQLAGPIDAIQEIAREILAVWPGAKMPLADADATWAELRDFRWAHPNGELIKVPLNPNLLSQFARDFSKLGPEPRWRVSSGGNVAFVSLPNQDQTAEFGTTLRSLDLSGMTVRGSGPLWLGQRSQPDITLAVKKALDPSGRFPSLEE